MKRILYVLPDLEYNGAARQMLYLAMGLPADRFELRVCALSTAGPWRGELVRARISLDALGWRRSLDAKPLVELHKIIRAFQPDAIHVWRMPAVRAVQLAAIGTGARLIVSSALPAGSQGSAVGLLDRWLLRRAQKVVAGSQYEMQVLRSLGLTDGQIALVSPAVKSVGNSENAALHDSLGLKPDTRLLACVGPLDSDKGFRDAVWALDILHFIFADVHLLFIGSGAAQVSLEHFSRVLTVGKVVHFVGPQENVPALLAQVDMVWVPSHRNTGVNAVLEAMAAGRPVVATRMPLLMELLPAELRPHLVAIEDQGSLARQTRLLLDDRDRCVQLGETGRKHVAEHYSLRELVERSIRVYDEVAK